LAVNFTVHAILDGTNKPKVQDLPVPGASVHVFTRRDACTNGLYVGTDPKRWGKTFDGLDGVNPADPGCPIVSYGTYQAVGTTDANGNATIIVPPTTSDPNIDYVIIARTDKFDYIKTASSTDILYSEYGVPNINAGQTKKVPLHQLATYGGKILPATQAEFFGTYLDLVQPETFEFTDD